MNSAVCNPLVAATTGGAVAWASMVARGEAVLRDPDVFMHIAVGRWVLEHGRPPRWDVFSHSMTGAPWVAHEWLSEVAIAWLHDALGWAGLVAAAAACFAMAIATLTYSLARCLPIAAVAALVVGAWAMCFPHLLARPHVAAFPLLVYWMVALTRARAANESPPLWLVLPMILWANIHGSFVLGLLFAGLFAAEAIYDAEDRASAWRAVRQWGVFFALSIVSATATPYGISGLIFPLQVEQMSFALSWLNEWQQPDMQRGHVLEVWLMFALWGALALGIRLPMTRIPMLLLLLHMALLHQRHTAILGLCAPVIASNALGPQLEPLRHNILAVKLGRVIGTLSRTKVRIGLVAVAFAIAASTGLWRLPMVGMPSAYAPVAAVQAVRAAGLTGPVFNSYGLGGYLMFVGISPFIDGRADMYGDDFVRRFRSVADLPRLLSEYRIAWTLLYEDDPHVAEFDRMPGWRRFYASGKVVVHVRSP